MRDGCMGFCLVENPLPSAPPQARTKESSHSHLANHGASHTRYIAAAGRTRIYQGKYLQPGERFRYSFAETKIDWWSWGTKEEPTETEIWLLDWIRGPILSREGRLKKRKEDDLPEVFVETTNSGEFVTTVEDA